MKSVGSPNLRNNLVVVIFTLDIYSEIVKPRSMAKVCYKVGNKSMIETAIENALRLNPVKIILYVSKHNIECINKIIKYTNYAKMVSYSIVDNFEIKRDADNKDDKTMKEKIHNRLLSGIKCFKGRNVLFIPGNSPLLDYKILYKMVHDVNTDMKINNNFFYLKKESLSILPYIQDVRETDLSILGTSGKEIKQIETKGDLDEINGYINKKH